MKKEQKTLPRIAVFCSFCFLLMSCVSKKNAVAVPPADTLNYSCGTTDIHNTKTYYPESTFAIDFVVKNGDTLTPKDFICLDSVRFTKALSEIKVHEMCLEMGVQGNTYFSMYTNKYGGFEDVKVVRTLEDCFKSTEEEIKLKVGKMRILQEEYFNSEIIFHLQFRIHSSKR